MRYHHIVRAEFIDRPNRFIAHVKLAGKDGGNLSVETVHVKNTGRCGELLVPGAAVYLEKSENVSRSTAYDLVAVEKGDRLINIDSQAPNRAVLEWLQKRELFPDMVQVRPETTYGQSRFDFYIETEGEKIFLEVKGVTRELDGVVCFPDAPSERAVKHVEELAEAKKNGYRAIVLFVVQMGNVRFFTPDVERHAAFAESLRQAAERGVEVLAYDCFVTAESMEIGKRIPVSLTGEEPAEPERREPAGLERRKPAGLERREPAGPEHREFAEPERREQAEAAEGFAADVPSARLEDIPTPLLKWYDKNRRILPWREKPTPYRVWVSEIMLQQTRVEAVKPYFERFMRELPDIGALARAEEETLLKLWEGLGYYNRVRNLQRAAVQIQERYGGEMPRDYDALLGLTGIGSYTAGAIASIAFGIPKPAVDGNVLRVLSRIRGDERSVSDPKVKQAVEKELEAAVPTDRPGDFNQAMMEIGACVCIPNGAPHCGECPLRAICRAHALGREQEYPQKDAKKGRSAEEKTILLIRDENKVALRKRPSKGLLAGMYEFPSLEGYRTAEEVVRYLAENGVHALQVKPLREAKHIFTHKEWHMKGYMVRVDELETGEPGEGIRDWIYIEPEETREKYPIPSAFEAYAEYLKMIRGKERWNSE